MKTKSEFKINTVGFKKPENEVKLLVYCNKIDDLFKANCVEWSALHNRFYKCLQSAMHLIKHQKTGTKNVEFDTFVIDKNIAFSDINKFYEYKNKIYDILRKEVDRMNGNIKVNDIIIHKKLPYIIKKIRMNTLDRYFRRYDLIDNNGEKIEVDNQSEWWNEIENVK